MGEEWHCNGRVARGTQCTSTLVCDGLGGRLGSEDLDKSFFC